MAAVIKPFWFLLSFSIGILYVYVSVPKKTIVERHPSPFNKDLKFKDANGLCYKYAHEKVDCKQSNETTILPQPIVENFRKKQLASV